mmetsp:Transcript_6866/g.14816  ORF Transcript_6866/g.14816 Transcript_6866/m.14816 type:complete len:343 (-) Transcript_6866:624-1652(-)
MGFKMFITYLFKLILQTSLFYSFFGRVDPIEMKTFFLKELGRAQNPHSNILSIFQDKNDIAERSLRSLVIDQYHEGKNGTIRNVTMLSDLLSSDLETEFLVPCGKFGFKLHFSSNSKEPTDLNMLRILTEDHLTFSFRDRFPDIYDVVAVRLNLTPYQPQKDSEISQGCFSFNDISEECFSSVGSFRFRGDVPSQKQLDEVVIESFRTPAVFSFVDAVRHSGDNVLMLVDNIDYFSPSDNAVTETEDNTFLPRTYNKMLIGIYLLITTACISLFLHCVRTRKMLCESNSSLARLEDIGSAEDAELPRRAIVALSGPATTLTAITEEDTHYFDTDFDAISVFS